MGVAFPHLSPPLPTTIRLLGFSFDIYVCVWSLSDFTQGIRLLVLIFRDEFQLSVVSLKVLGY